MAKNVPAGKQSKQLSKLIEKYYADLAEFEHQRVMFEMGTRHAFHRLMADAGKPHGWTLIAEQEKKVNGKTIRPDGTFKDQMNLVRGYWEAKDTQDKLDAEIEKKRKAGYPLNNIIFEDTQTAVLFQHGARVLSVEMKDPVKLAELIIQFFRYVEPEIEEFEQAVDEFKERVPDLAQGLAKKIDEAHRTNRDFKKAFADFFELCQSSLNPNLSQAAVDEMLIQHILTERLIREIFDNPEFVRRNVIAAEVEKVMLAMTSQSFDRKTYLKELDRFYVAIEHAARTMTDFSDKQHFLNTVYERFFQGYSVKLADTMGIVYTPQEIVDFMCASVAEVLEKEFGKKLWSDDVYIIDPCTGTGNFIVNLIRRIPKAKLESVYKHRLFANEIMLLPYYIAALNIEHAYYEQTGKYESFEGLCFVDTLDLAENRQGELGFMTAKNSERVERQKKSPITVVIGNPPYNVGQANENDNNKNRRYPAVDERIRQTFARDSRATLKNKLYDPYVRFFRWACDRLEGRDGVVCFVTNNSFVDQNTFDGVRKHLLKEFTFVHHVDLHGNVRQNPKLSGTTHNVFGIQVGVGITIAVRKRSSDSKPVKYYRVPETWRKEEKLGWLRDAGFASKVEWTEFGLDGGGNWRQLDASDDYDGFAALTLKSLRAEDTQPIFDQASPGLNSGRDSFVYSFDREELGARVIIFCDLYNAELDRYRRHGRGQNVDDFVDYSKIKWSEGLKNNLKRGREASFGEDMIAHCTYRPFTVKSLYYDETLVDRPGLLRHFWPASNAMGENRALWLKMGGEWPFFSLVTANLVDYLPQGGSQVIPFYVYDEDGTNRRENITDWALKQFREHYKDKKIDKWGIFYYVYGVLHHPGYREKFADNLKRELPRIPFAPDFKAFSKAGKKLAALHLDYEQLDPWELDFNESPGMPLSYHVDDKMRLSKDKLRLTVNPSLTLTGIPPEAFNYRLGNRSALEWVIDQYQISTDKRSGITSEPNREDDPEYIVRLVGQVIRVSMETVKIVESLPGYEGELA
ncbi:MAG: type ISP restriction/modification enzyme [Planctomycetota bacterium]|nr:type ISP restriction/modification enzyme [Planctomycetota bacterium]